MSTSPSLRRPLLRAATALLAGVALHSATAASAPQFDAAFAPFQQALQGDDGAADRAAQRFEQLLQAEPADPVLLAYAGAAVSLKARGTLLPWKKMAYAEDGLARVDKALALLQPAHDLPLYQGAASSLQTRFVAASTFLAMPPMLQREARGQRLLNEVLASPLLAKAPLPFQGAVWLRAGQQALKDKQPDAARRWFGEVVSHQAPQAAAARSALQAVAP
jgi:hypothetical protein